MDNNTKPPKHIGIILDGNRRWARENKVTTREAHQRGYELVDVVAEHSHKVGVEYLTFYVFSTENWNRSPAEVHYLMALVKDAVAQYTEKAMERGTKILHLGNLDDRRVPSGVKKAITGAIDKTKDNTEGVLSFCFNYGGTQEIIRAFKLLLEKGKLAKDITEKDIANNLYSPELPPLDLIIRTSGEQRLSNFMIWRAAYAELVFVKKHWPDFTTKDFDEAIAEYQKRERRFGAK